MHCHSAAKLSLLCNSLFEEDEEACGWYFSVETINLSRVKTDLFDNNGGKETKPKQRTRYVSRGSKMLTKVNIITFEFKLILAYNSGSSISR